MIPDGPAPDGRLAPARRRARRRSHHDAARRVRRAPAAPPGSARPTHSAKRPFSVVRSRGSGAGRARRARRRESRCWSSSRRVQAAAAKATLPPRRWSSMVAAALLGPLLALPFAWLLGLPIAAVSRAPGPARAREHASKPAPRGIGRDAGDARHIADLHDPVRQISATATDRRTDKPARRGADMCCARRTHPACLRQSRQPHAPCQGSRSASGSIATSVVVAADGVNLRSFPARGVDASTLRGVVDLGVRSGSLADLAGNALAVGSSSAHAFGWHIGDKVDALARRRHAGHAASRSNLRAAARLRRRRPSARAGRTARHQSPRRRRIREEPLRAPTRRTSSRAYAHSRTRSRP